MARLEQLTIILDAESSGEHTGGLCLLLERRGRGGLVASTGGGLLGIKSLAGLSNSISNCVPNISLRRLRHEHRLRRKH
jgi:hypothetical protein